VPEINQNSIEEIKELIYGYFSEECDIPKEEITDETDIIEDLEGDSLMLLSLLEIVRKRYSLNIELKTLGKHLMKKPANSVGEVITLTVAIVEHGDNIINVAY
jgi:acyl carrier protein